MEMLLLLNTLKEQQIRILLGRTSIGNSQKVQMATDADAPETQIGFITVNFKLEVIYFNNYHTLSIKKSMLNKMNYQETTDWMFNSLCINFKVRLLIRRT
jgi:hypothetical protein